MFAGNELLSGSIFICGMQVLLKLFLSLICL
jgi:hypothetical protein